MSKSNWILIFLPINYMGRVKWRAQEEGNGKSLSRMSYQRGSYLVWMLNDSLLYSSTVGEKL